jgi:hypothetical protein
MLFEASSLEQPVMNVQKEFNGYLTANADALDTEDHRIDVPEHLDGSDIVWRFVKPSRYLGLKQPSGADIKTLDSR